MIYTCIETSPNVCIGKPYLLNSYIDTQLLYREPACIVGLQVAVLELADFWTIFFPSVSARLKEKVTLSSKIIVIFIKKIH